MKEIRTYPVYPSDLNVLSAFRQVGEHLNQCAYAELLGCCSNERFTLRINPHRTINARSFAEFLQVLESYPDALSLWVHSHWQHKNNGTIMCGVDIERREIVISAEADDLNTMAGLHDKMRDIFRASVPVAEKSPHLARYNLKKSVFLAHRFDEHGDATATSLAIFLRRLGFDVAEGAGYEARDIPDKVMERIRSRDVFICLTTPGDLSWVSSEAAFAKGLGKYIIVICQENAKPNSGIIGSDFEYLCFQAGNIEKIFCDLLYALPG